MVSVGKPRYSKEDGYEIVSASIEVEGSGYEIGFRVSGGPIASGLEPFLAAALVPAMKQGDPLRLPGPVSPRLLENAGKIQDILHAWYPGLRKIPVETEEGCPAAPGPGRGVACFFSGGVDSFYSIQQNYDEIDALIFVHGFDIRLDDWPLRSKIARAIREAARELGKPLIEVETNLRAFSDPLAEWALQYHGAALASVALLLASQFQKIYLPSTYSYAQLHPFGSHSLLDPLWSSETMEVVHDGAEATRFEKIALIATSDMAMMHLRVCWENRDGEYNCCRCEKCLYTMACLRVVGALEYCRTFARPLALEAIAVMPFGGVSAPLTLSECLRALEEQGADPELAEAIRQRLKKRELPNREEMDLLARQLDELRLEVTTLQETVAAYERGRAMRLLNAISKLRRRVVWPREGRAQG